MKRITIILAAGIFILIIAMLLKSCGNDSSVLVSAEHPQKRTIIETVSANGKIQPEVEVKISSDVSGEIVELLVKEGDRVKKGDLLCRIKPDIYESALERVNASVNSSKANLQNTRAQLDQARANLANSEATYNRNKKLFDQNAISQQEFDGAKAQYEGAKAQVKAAEETVKSAEFGINSSEASLKEASENLHKTMIYAPVEGTVSKLNVEAGERVLGVNSMQGTEIMRLANLNEMEVSVEVNENDIVRVKRHDTTLIEVDAYNNRQFKGIVTEVANSANTTAALGASDQVTNFVVKIRILQESYKDLINPNNPAPFRPGMSATVEIQTQRALNVLSVPIQSVTTRVDSLENKQKDKNAEEENSDLVVKNDKEENIRKAEKKREELVFLVADGKARKVIVKTGIQNSDFIQILAGLSEKDQVVSGPYTAVSKKLKDGDKVKVTDKDKLFKESK